MDAYLAASKKLFAQRARNKEEACSHGLYAWRYTVRARPIDPASLERWASRSKKFRTKLRRASEAVHALQSLETPQLKTAKTVVATMMTKSPDLIPMPTLKVQSTRRNVLCEFCMASTLRWPTARCAYCPAVAHASCVDDWTDPLGFDRLCCSRCRRDFERSKRDRTDKIRDLKEQQREQLACEVIQNIVSCYFTRKHFADLRRRVVAAQTAGRRLIARHEFLRTRKRTKRIVVVKPDEIFVRTTDEVSVAGFVGLYDAVSRALLFQNEIQETTGSFGKHVFAGCPLTVFIVFTFVLRKRRGTFAVDHLLGQAVFHVDDSLDVIVPPSRAPVRTLDVGRSARYPLQDQTRAELRDMNLGLDPNAAGAALDFKIATLSSLVCLAAWLDGPHYDSLAKPVGPKGCVTKGNRLQRWWALLVDANFQLYTEPNDPHPRLSVPLATTAHAERFNAKSFCLVFPDRRKWNFAPPEPRDVNVWIDAISYWQLRAHQETHDAAFAAVFRRSCLGSPKKRSPPRKGLLVRTS